MDNRDNKGLGDSEFKYFSDLDYSNKVPTFGDYEPTEPAKQQVEKRSHSFFPALVGAIVGGLIVAILIFGGLYFSGLLSPRTTVSSGDEVAKVQEAVETSGSGSTIQAVAQVVPKSVVGVSAIGTQQENTLFGPQSQQFQSTGSGFFVTSDGYVVTNQHVVVNNDSQITISTQDGEEHEGKLVWSDANLDIALVKADVKDVQALSIGNSDDIKVGEEVIAVGNPLGLAYSRSVTAGIVSAVNRSLVVDNTLVAEGLIQTDAAINQGNSGGPLVNTSGEVIGVNTYKQSQGEGMGFAIPINLFKPIIDEVVETGTFKPVVIGITGYDPEQAQYMGNGQGGQLPNFKSGVYVTEVTPGSSAQTAGIQQGDIIKSVDGKDITTMIQLRTILYSHKDGDKAKIVYERGGKEYTTEMTLKKS